MPESTHYSESLVAELEAAKQRCRELEAALSRCETELQASETRYRTFLDHTTDGLFLHGPDGRVVDVNQRACESLGYRREELIGLYPTDFDPSVTAAEIQQKKKRLQSGESLVFDSRHRRKDGSEFPVEVRIRPLWIDGKSHALALACDISSRKRAENQLRESEERFRALVECCAQAVWESDPQGRVLSDSPSWRAYTGQTIDQWMDDRWSEAIHPSDRDQAVRQWRETIRTGELLDIEYRLRRSDGTWRWTNVRATPVVNPDGTIRKWVGMNIDITDRKQAEETVQRIVEVTSAKTGQDFFKMLVQQVSHVCQVAFAYIAEVDRNDPNLVKTIAVTRGGELIDNFSCDLRDTPCENVIGNTMRFYPEGIQQAFPKDKLLKGMGLESYLGTPLFASSGEPLGLIAMLHSEPIAQPEQAKAILRVVAARAGAELERKRAEEALRDSQRFVQRIASASPHVIYVFDRMRQKVVYCNRPAGTDLGYTFEEIGANGGELFFKLLHPDDLSRRQERVERWDTTRDDEILQTEYRIRDRNGSWHWFLAHDTVFTRTADGQVEQIIGTAQDITAWKQAEEDLAARQAELLHASRLTTVGRMVAALSHEVAQPLSAIGNFAAASEQIMKSLEKPSSNGGPQTRNPTVDTGSGVRPEVEARSAEPRNDDEAVAANWHSLRTYIQSIAKQNQRCGAILERLRDFSQRTTANRTECEIAELLHDSVALVSNELRRHNVTVRFALAENLPPVIGDRVQLQQVVVNLLTNARDAVRDQPVGGRSIMVRAGVADSLVVFDVEDSGSGFSDDMATHLFEPFYTTKAHGMGIGLSICNSIVKDHRGQIEAVNNQSGGATFRVRLPISGKEDHG